MSQNLTARSQAKPSAYFLKLAALQQKAIRADSKLTAPAIQTMLVGRHLRVAVALYSAGQPASASLQHVVAACECLHKSFRTSLQEPIKGIPLIHPYVEAMAGSRLVNMHRDVVMAYRSAKFGIIQPWEKSLLDGLCAALMGEPNKPRRIESIEAPDCYGPRFDAVLDCVVGKDTTDFARRLEDYLLSEWGPVLDKQARSDLNSRTMHAGKWSVFAPAMCLAIGQKPALSENAAQYFPFELLGQAENGVSKASAARAEGEKPAIAPKRSSGVARRPSANRPVAKATSKKRR